MDRTAFFEAHDDRAAAMFRRVLANWTLDLLRKRPRIEWPNPQPAEDYRDRDWAKLYEGSVLDD